jgi:hypothetical protein
VRYFFKRGSERRISHLGNDGGRYAYCLGLEKLDGLAPAACRD